MSSCLILYQNDKLYMSSDTSACFKSEDGYARFSNNAEKIKIINNMIVFTAGDLSLCQETFHFLEIYKEAKNAPYLLSKFLQKYENVNDYDLEVMIGTVFKNKIRIYQISSYKNFDLIQYEGSPKGIGILASGVHNDELNDFVLNNFESDIKSLYRKAYSSINDEIVGGNMLLYYMDIYNQQNPRLIDEYNLDNYINPKYIKTKNIHYVLAKNLVGQLILGNSLGIYSEDDTKTMTFDNYGLKLNVKKNETTETYTRLLDIQKDGESMLYIDEDGNIILKTDQIIQMTDSIDRVVSEYADIEKLYVKSATLENLLTKYAKVDDLEAFKGEFKELVATDAEIEEIKAGNVTIAGWLKAQSAEVNTLKATMVTTDTLDAYKATIENLLATYATIEYLKANYIDATTLDADYAKISLLESDYATIEKLNSATAEINTLIAKKASIEDLDAVNATITTLNTDLANVKELVATKVDAEEVKAQIVESTKTITEDLEAVHAVIDVLDTKYATIEQLNVQKATLEELIAKKAAIEELDAAKASITELDSTVANINTILAGNIGTGSLQAIHLTAQNVLIDDAIIKSANISDLDVSKLNAGTISTNKFAIQSDDGGIVISGSTQQFTDSNGKVRLQVGQDAQGDFNFIVFGEDGTTAIYNENGITAKAVPDGLVVDKMVADDANISGKKLDIDSVVEKINEDGTTNISSNKIWIDEESQSLGAKFTSIENKISTTSGDLTNFISQTTTDIENLQGQIDGSIQTFFYEYVPTNDNVPANEWTTTDLKNNHLGDLFYNTLTGYCYRWQVINNEYSWQRITDVDVTKALADAAKAQDTADGKRRVFVDTPTTPYDVGDLWTQGSTGDILKCKTAKTESQTYEESDWEKASKYTDDTKVDEVSETVTTLQTDFEVEQGKITSLIKETTEIKETVDNINIGGRNFIRNNSSLSYTNSSSIVITAWDISPFFEENGTSATGTISFDAKINEGETSATYRCYVNPTNGKNKYQFSPQVVFNPTEEWVRYSEQFKYLNSNESASISEIMFYRPSGNCTLNVKNIKVETGNMPTGYSPAPEDSTEQVTELTEKYNQLSSTVDGNTTTISNIKTTVEGMETSITEIKETADGVSTTVTANKDKWDQASTDATAAKTSAEQTASKFSWIVKSGTSESDFELTDRTATLIANNINLNGLVTFSGLDSDAQTLINSKANQSIIDNWAKDSVVSGETIINGGYLMTNTITTDQLDVNSVFADTAVINLITAYDIDARHITSGTISANRLDVYGLSVLNTETNKQTFGVTNKGEVTIVGSVSSENYLEGTSGWSINNDGSAEFNNVVARGSVIADDGGIASEKATDNAKKVRFWAGSTYNNRESAPFIVYSDGSIKATQGEFSGVFSGTVDIGNIKITDPSSSAGQDALFTVRNGESGSEIVKITDSTESTFAQDISIRANNTTGSKMINLGQDGYGTFTNGIVVGSKVKLSTSSILLNNNELTYDASGLATKNQLTIGTANQTSKLLIYGNNEMTTGTVNESLSFGSVAKITKVYNGIDIDIFA